MLTYPYLEDHPTDPPTRDHGLVEPCHTEALLEEAAAPKDYDFKTGGGTGEAEAMDLVKPLPETIPAEPQFISQLDSPEIHGLHPSKLEVYGIGFTTVNPKKAVQ